MKNDNNKEAIEIAESAWKKYWPNSTSYDVILREAMYKVTQSINEGDDIGMQARIIIMIVPALLIERDIMSIRRYFDQLVEISSFTYEYNEDVWEESMMSFIEVHRRLVDGQDKDIDLGDLEKALRFILITTTDYTEKALLSSLRYTYTYILPLELTARMQGVKLSDVITLHKTMYAAVRRNKNTRELQHRIGCKPNIEDHYDFSNILWCYKMALASGFIRHDDAIRIKALLSDTDDFNSVDTLTSVSFNSLLDFPEVDSDDAEINEN